jgi:two-component system, NtrC family, sensor kinase
LLNKYDEIKDGNDFDLKSKEISQLKKELDTKYLITEMNSLLQGIEDGALRTAEIVKGLRNFSRIDESGLKIANIHDGLDSTITLLNNTLKNKIKIVREYGNLPQVECFPGKLNQFFMNVINNAAQAIFAKKNMQEEGVIHIKTYFDQKNVYVSIRDNGIGMSEETKRRVFEPFFTTKDVGEGTGLGLSIGYSIIESHSGNIQVESQEGVGTEFLLTLPIVHVPNK